MRVVLAPEGSRGDVQPLLALGEALVERGCEVLVAAPPEAEPWAAARGLPFRASGPGARAFLQTHAAAVQGSVLSLHRRAEQYVRESMPQQLATLREACADADLLVAAGVQLLGRSVADLEGIPYRYVAYTPAMFASRAHPPFIVKRQTLPGWLNRLGWRAFEAFYGVVIGRMLNGQRAELGLPPVRDALGYFFGERPLLAADPELAPLPADAAHRAESLGALHPRVIEDLPPKLEAFLASGPPPVYLGFGSMPDPDPARTTRELLDAVCRLGLRAIVSEGWAGLGGGPLPEGVIAIGDVPHALLFPRVAVVVHHGGAGTTAAATRAGVPQVVVPHLLDQFYFAHRVALLGLGPPALPRKRLGAASLAAQLEACLDNEMLAERAAELGARVRRRDAAGAISSRLLSGIEAR
jgi:UDP:flavonoid glycosyltransferase YjiC (YdhE family)